MSDIVITWPKTRPLQSYLDELAKAEAQGLSVFYSVASRPRTKYADFCFHVHDGFIRGWLMVLGVMRRNDVTDPITGTTMRAGLYIARRPLWHPLETPIALPGFRGWRYADGVVGIPEQLIQHPSER